MKHAFLLSVLFIMSVPVQALTPLPWKTGLNFALFTQWNGVHFNTASGIPVQSDNDMRGMARIGCFFDMGYIRFDAAYTTSIGDTAYIHYQYSTNNPLVLSNSNNQYFISLGALAKYPFTIRKDIRIWPAAGLEYQICVFSGWHKTNSLTNSFDNPHDLFLKIGCGADIELLPHLFFIPVLFAGFDLLPFPFMDTGDDPLSVKRSFGDIGAFAYNWKLELNAGIAWEF